MAVLGALGDLVLALSADTARFQSDLGKGHRLAEKFGREVQQVVGDALGRLFALGGAAGFSGLVQGQIDAADAAGKLGQKLGLTTETLSSYMVAAQLADVSTEQVQTGLTRLIANASQAAQGVGDATDAFAALGLSQQDVARLMKQGTNVLFEEIVGRLEDFRDGANKTALAVKFFGKSGAELMPLINSFKAARREAEELNYIIDKDTAASAEVFNDNMTRVGISVKALGMRVARELLPEMKGLSAEMVEFAKNADTAEASATALRIFFQTILVLGANVAYVLRMTGAEIGGIAAQLAALLRLDFRGFANIRDEMVRDAEAARQKLDEYEKRVMDSWGKKVQQQTAFQADIRKFEQAMAKKNAPPIKDDSKAKAALAAELREREKIARLIEEGREEEARVAVEASQALAAIDRKRGEERIADAQRATDAWVESAELSMQAAEEMIYTWDAAGERIEVTREAFAEMESQTKKNKDAARDLGLTFSSAFEDAVLGGDKLRDVLKGLAQDVARIFLRKSVSEPLAEGATKLFKNFDFGSFLGLRAEGGPVSGGSPYIVGERGPELFVPGASGAIVPNHAMGRGGGPTFNVDMRGASLEAVQRLEAFVMRLDGTLEMRAVGAVFEENLRGNRV